MADYSRAKAKKKESKTLEFEEGLSKTEKKKISSKVKKSPLVLIALIFLVVGAVAGYFAFDYLSTFEMNEYKVNGVVSTEADYVVIDFANIKEELEKTDDEVLLDELYAVALEDGGVTCKIFGIDITNSVSIKYYYREDISKDAKEVKGIDVKVPGVYYIEYSSSNFLYKSNSLIRTIVVTEVENG